MQKKTIIFHPAVLKKQKQKKTLNVLFVFFKLSAIHPSANAWQRLNLALLSLA